MPALTILRQQRGSCCARYGINGALRGLIRPIAAASATKSAATGEKICSLGRHRQILRQKVCGMGNSAKGSTMVTRIILIPAMMTAAISLSGCLGTAATAVAGSAATGVVTSASNQARFERQTCAQLEEEVRNAQRSMINPLTIPSTRAYIRDVRAVAESKGCNLSV